jgi:hypothetical protein
MDVPDKSNTCYVVYPNWSLAELHFGKAIFEMMEPSSVTEVRTFARNTIDWLNAHVECLYVEDEGEIGVKSEYIAQIYQCQVDHPEEYL